MPIPAEKARIARAYQQALDLVHQYGRPMGEVRRGSRSTHHTYRATTPDGRFTVDAHVVDAPLANDLGRVTLHEQGKPPITICKFVPSPGRSIRPVPADRLTRLEDRLAQAQQSFGDPR